MTTASDSSPADPSKLSFESAIEEVESIIEQVDEGHIGLEDSLEAYQRGMALVKRCRTILDAAEQKVQTLSEAFARDNAGTSADESGGDAEESSEG